MQKFLCLTPGATGMCQGVAISQTHHFHSTKRANIAEYLALALLSGFFFSLLPIGGTA